MNKLNPIERAVNWNKKRDNNDFSIRREVKMLAEELFEMCAYDRVEAKKLSEVFVKAHIDSRYSYIENTQNIQDVVDADGDMIFIASETMNENKFNKQEDTSTKTAESHQVEFLVRQKFEDMDKEQLVKLCYSAQDYLDYMMKINVTNMICDKWIIEKSLNETFWQKFVNDLQNNDKTV